MNSEKKERREAQLAKKAEAIKALASDVQMTGPNELLIDGHPYILLENYRDGFQIDKLKERFSQVLTKYDYIVGDIGYDQLRLHGFYEAGSKKGYPSQSIERLQDYLFEYCNFGCAYFVLKNLDVQMPEAAPKFKEDKVIRKSNKQRRKKRAYTEEKIYEVRTKRPLKSKSKVTKNKDTKKRHFTIRQKG
ncbi:YutD family protein [Ligilactobacillus sp. Marseille-Q7487]|uniref:YutD family protein n=1 Tax=Ligilactobacillus sp. Marseille-Q7487 TaxID=3022128 RepID=UPI0024A7AD30|nr:YutD family protein [Ligilactobacillus sp. Marseille-Q7487]